MNHLKQISGGGMSSYGRLSAIEQLILLLLTAFFSDYRNFASVIQNLQKFYSKT